MAGSNSESVACVSNENKDESELAMYKKQALNAVTFKFIYSKNDLDNKDFNFKPLMAHQVFGNSELIFGYKSLSINLYYLHNSIKCFSDIQYSGTINKTDMYEPDDINAALDSWLPANYTHDRKRFLDLLDEEVHDMLYGTLLNEFKVDHPVHLFPNQNVEATYKVTLADTNDPDFVNFHQNFETFIVWFIDAANFIDIEDERWMIFYVHEEFTHPETKKLYRTPIGFCTIYKFFAYPDKIRARISQFFILPTHQKRGIGTKFYELVIKELQSIPDIIDITVEEPTPTFQKIRECSDCQLIHKELSENCLAINKGNMKKLNQIFSKYKICKRQSKRILDLLGCCKAKKCGPFEYNNFLQTIKLRIAADCEKDAKTGKRFCSLPGFVPEPIDTKSVVESEFKKYIDEITPSVKYLLNHLK